MLIQGYLVNVDVAKELRKYDWTKPRWTGEKFHACSPFRVERRPSFAVRLDTGVWIDSGAVNEDWKKGNLVKLLAFLRNESYEEAEDYLLTEYQVFIGDMDNLKLIIDLTQTQAKPIPLPYDILEKYFFRHPYLQQCRGIEEKWQQGFRIGYCKGSRAVTFPWFNHRGQLVNIKFRSVQDKRFWYYTGGQPIKNHVYGLNFVHKTGKKRVYIVESEIDAITLWQAGFAAIALGGANMTCRQRNLILQSPIQELVIATDNDRAGERIKESIVNQLNGYLTLKAISLPEKVKDVNELSYKELLQVVENCLYITINPCHV